ncbi:hypothetical protein Tco_1167226 [Tanacetum coccineum]
MDLDTGEALHVVIRVNHSDISSRKMDNPDITMEEYIQLTADKARRRGQTFNWETATYGKEYGDDFDLFINSKTDFLAIVYNDASTSNLNVSSEPTISIYNGSLSHKLIPVDILKPKPVDDFVKINDESCSEKIDIKPMDSIVCISNETTPIEFDQNVETKHDTPGLNTAYPETWIRRIISCTEPTGTKSRN